MGIKHNLAKQLTTIRQQRGLSITEFSEELEIARSSLQDLLSGAGNPRTETIEHIANQLGIDPITLLSASPVTPAAESPAFTKDQQTALEQLLERLADALGGDHE